MLKNMYEKKLRTSLIVFAIIISTALLFAATTISDTMCKMYEERIRQHYGSADILITSNEKSPSPFFLLNGTKRFENHFDYIIGAFQGKAVYKTDVNETLNVSILGIDYDDIKTMNPIEIDTEMGLKPFAGKKIIISQGMSEKFNLTSGDYIDLIIKGFKYKFLICATAYPKGLFSEDGINIYAVIPKDILGSIYDTQGVGIAYLKLKNLDEKDVILKKLSQEYQGYSIKEAFSKKELNAQASTLTTSLSLITLIIFLMSIFIINSAFKVISMERLTFIGIIRSIGATRRMANIVLSIESLFYGALGGFLGCNLGIVILYIISYQSKPLWVKGFKATVQFSNIQLLTAFIAAIVLSIIGSILPIIKVSKFSIKDITLNSVESKQRMNSYRFKIGVFLFAATVILPPLLLKNQPLLPYVVCMVMCIVSVIILIPYLANVVVKILEKVYKYIFGNIGILAAKNLINNKSIHSNISLLAIGIASLFMINTISFSVGKQVLGVYNDFNFDLWLWNYDSNQNYENTLQKFESVRSICGVYELNNVEVIGKNSEIKVLQGINKNTFTDFVNVNIGGVESDVLNKLDKGRNLLLTNSLKEKFGVEKGEKLDLMIGDGVKQYKVIGFINTLMYSGNYAIVPERYLKIDAKCSFYSQFFIKTANDVDEVEKNIKNSYPESRIVMYSVDNLKKLDIRRNNQIFTILGSFSFLSMVIGILGVINNIILSCIERKRAIATLRLVGMQKFQVVKMLFIESVTSGITGSLFGIATGLLMVVYVGHIMKAISIPVDIYLSPSQLITFMLSGILITLTASISPAIKFSRYSIIESIKYE